MSQNNRSPLKFKAVFFFCCVNSSGYTLCYEYCIRALHETIIWDSFHFSWLCPAQHNLIGDRIAIGWFIFISFKICTHSRNNFLSIIFLYPLYRDCPTISRKICWYWACCFCCWKCWWGNDQSSDWVSIK